MGKLSPDVTGPLAVCARVRTLWRMAALDRNQEKMSQVAFCALADIETNTFNMWIKDKGPPNLEHGMKLCDAFNITLDWLYRGNWAGLPINVSDSLKRAEGVGGSAAVTRDRAPPFGRQRSSRSR